MKKFGLFFAVMLVASILQAAQPEITVYSGRTKSLIDPLIVKFTEQTGIKVNIRYGDTAQLAATILEEGKNTPADIFYAQDAGALDAVAAAGRLKKLSPALLEKVNPRFRSPEGIWIGTSGRARVIVYNPTKLKPEDLPESILGLTDPKWKGRIGWAPSNGSFQAHVTAMRLVLGEEKTRAWIKGIMANEPKVYPKNSPIVAAVATGEIDVGLVNHYYLFGALKEKGPDYPARNFYTKPGDIGSLVNVSGAAVVDVASHPVEAEKFIEFLLSAESQKFFADETFEYPVVPGSQPNPLLKPLDEIGAPDIDLSKLSDLKKTLELLQETGALE